MSDIKEEVLPETVESVDELTALEPIPEFYTLVSGLEVRVLPLKTRQFFRFLRIITRGAAPILNNLQLDPELGQNDFFYKLLVTVTLAIPEAEEETIDFLCSMVEPVGLKNQKTAKDWKDINKVLWERLAEDLAVNPELDDTLGLVELIVKRESKDIQALGKKLASMLKMAQVAGEIPKPSEEPKPSESGTKNDETESQA